MKQDAIITIRIEAAIYEELRQRAIDNYRTIAKQINYELNKIIKEDNKE